VKILYLDHAAELGGAEVSLLGLLRTLDRTRFAPALACPPGTLRQRAQALGVTVLDLSTERLLKNLTPWGLWLRLRRGSAAVERAARERASDALHANTLRVAVLAARVARRLRLPLIWHVRDRVTPEWVRRRLLRRCDIAIAPSRFIANSLGAQPKIRVVPNGIDPADVPPEEAVTAFRQELGIPTDASLVGCMGRLHRWKGQHYFLDVAARLARELGNVTFLVVGAPLHAAPGDTYAAELADTTRRLGLEGRVRFLGHRADPLVALSAMDVVVNCSRDEPFGRVLIEAMACRRPVVAFRSGAVPEIVEDSSTGFLVPFGDTASMAEAVAALVRNRTRAEAYGEAGRQRVATRFTLAASTRAVEAIYAELAAGRGAAP